MSRSLLLRGLRSAAYVATIGAFAIVMFGSGDFTALVGNGHFWATLGAAGIGGFVGGLFKKERKATNG